MRILFLLFLVGCSGVQGVPMPPRAPSFSPVLDAPITTGQPGFVGSPKEVPRGTDRRVLPPTREPGIWASDGPTKASAEDEPPHDDGDEWFARLEPDEMPTTPRCRRELAGAVIRLGKQSQREQLPKTPRSCLTARLYLHCANRELAALQKYGHVLDSDAYERAKIEIPAANDRAFRFYANACRGVAPWQNVEDLFSLIVMEFEKTSEIPRW
jgi:hypothetical protein